MQRRIEAARQSALNKALDHGAQIRSQLDYALSATYPLAALVQGGRDTIPGFERIAGRMLPLYKGVSALQLAPEGVVRQSVPLAGNEKAIGHDLLADPKRNAEAFVAVATRRMTLAGPFELLQGGTAIVGRLPVFVPAPGGGEEFWGFVTALIRLPDFLPATRVGELAGEKYLYDLSRLHRDAPRQVFSPTPPPRLRDPVSYRFEVHNAQWELRLEPTQGWISWRDLAVELALVLAVALLVGFIAYWMAREPARLRRLVEERSAELRRQATHDPLTGLPNRALLHDRMEQAIANAARSGNGAAVMLLDLDHFKYVNDSLGHQAGDTLLRNVAERLEVCLRKTDTVARVSPETVARVGGDEFVLLLPGVLQGERLAAVTQRILGAVSQPLALGGRELQVSCSVGIALYPKDGRDADTLLKNADAALYQAKEAGRNGFQFFTEELNARATERLSIEAQLRSGLGRSDLRLHYQPQVDLKTGSVVGAEALLRWQHPELGLLAPGRFIGIAEDTGLIVPVGEWVLREACRQAKAWQDNGVPGLTIAVNLSALQFRQASFVDTLGSILEESGLDPRWLELEITESVVMHDVAWVIEQLRRLKDRGVQLSIDDFGTGYSSLNYLRRFPVDKLKIDMSFVREITVARDAVAIATLVIDIGHTLGMRVIAEGVETQEQARILTTQGCDEAQGYLYSKPLAPDAFEESFLRAIAGSY